MHRYLQHLTTDLEAAILARWQECPPHFFQMGHTAERWLTPPDGYDGPPAGYAIDDPDAYPPLPDFMSDDDGDDDGDVPGDTMSGGEPYSAADLDFDETIAEMEQWRDEDPPERQDMFYHLGFEPEQFPPAEQLTDAELDTLATLLCRLWAAYNFTAAIPDKAPGRIVYPLLLQRMRRPTFVFKRGNIGVEFCDYEPKNCPFGQEWCRCLRYKDDFLSL